MGIIVATASNTMSSLLTDLGTVVTQVFSWVSDVASTIVSTPLLLLTTGFLVLGEHNRIAESKSRKKSGILRWKSEVKDTLSVFSCNA